VPGVRAIAAGGPRALRAAPSTIPATVPAANVESARRAGLRYATDDSPGITRTSVGDKFSYCHPDGRRVRDAATLDRIRALVIPPAWTQVWIAPSEHAHIQATGRDARGRKQYRYHPKWTEVRDEAKYGRLVDFAHALPAIRRRVEADLRRPPLSRDRVLATVVRLLERTNFRIGNDEYMRANGSHGLTTLQNRHVRVIGPRLRFRFRAKSGVMQQVDLEDATLARSVKTLQELPGQMLFQYVDSDGATQRVDSEDVNAYLRDASGEDFTAKDFRTWAATVEAACALEAADIVAGTTARKRTISTAIAHVASQLGNTRAVCRKCYIHPEVLASFMRGDTLAGVRHVSHGRRARGLTADEAAVVTLLQRRVRAVRRRLSDLPQTA
jgi:DNA topoisomerase-1